MAASVHHHSPCSEQGLHRVCIPNNDVWSRAHLAGGHHGKTILHMNGDGKNFFFVCHMEALQVLLAVEANTHRRYGEANVAPGSTTKNGKSRQEMRGEDATVYTPLY